MFEYRNESPEVIYTWPRKTEKRITKPSPIQEAYQLVCDILDGKKDDTYLEEVRGYLGQALDA